MVKTALPGSERNTNMKKKILAIGNYTDAMYHGFTGVDERLKTILSDYDVICTDQTAKLLTLKEDSVSGVISYLDIWNSSLSDEKAAALENFVTDGGAALLLHNGISIQSQPPLLRLAGGKFLGHPQHEEIRFEPKPHAITTSCSSFSLDEEPYQIEMVPDEKEIILTYEYRDKEYPAGWCKTAGCGRLVYLCPGHTPEIFDCPQYRQLIRRSMAWTLKEDRF